MSIIRVASLFAQFVHNSRGQVAIALAISLVPIVSVLGVAVDYSRANAVRASLQGALDAGVLAGLADNTSTRDQTAKATFQADFKPAVPVTAAPSFVLNKDATYSGSATVSVPTTTLGIIHVSSIAVSAQSTAAIGRMQKNAKQALCIISLNGTAQKAIDDSASSAVNAPECIVQVNSNNTDAVDLSGSAKINSAENCFVGKLHTSGSASVSPAPDAVCTAMADPFAGYSKPTVGACDHTNYKPVNNETLKPGVYCGGLNISSVTVTFAPGLYIIKDGLLQPSGGSSMTGDGVSFFLTGKGAGVVTSGGSSWHLTAMTTGTLAGFVFFLDTSGGPASKSELSGTSELYFEGVIYLPTQQLTVSGGSATYTTALFTAYIADTYVISGSSALNINSDPSQTSIPVPSALLAGSSGGTLRLIN